MVLDNPTHGPSADSAYGVPVSDLGPNDRMVFSVVPMSENGYQIEEAFTPKFYPDRFNKVMEKELNRNGQQCKGEDVSIKNFKNSELHATGILLSENISTLEKINAHDGTVDLYTPISPNGGIGAYVKKVEIGEVEGWNPDLDTWMFNYTIDMVSTGIDEYGGEGTNDVVSSALESVNGPDITDSDAVQT